MLYKAKKSLSSDAIISERHCGTTRGINIYNPQEHLWYICKVQCLLICEAKAQSYKHLVQHYNYSWDEVTFLVEYD